MQIIEFIEMLHWGALFQIILIDILLGGDNAVVIALACRKLDHKRRIQGIVWGTAGAVVLRVILIAFALTLLAVPYLKIVGGLLLLWIGIKLMLPDDHHDSSVHGADSLWSAVRTIVIADLAMSLDNVIAIAAAAENTIPDHQLGYVIFGLLFSVPIIVWGSTLVLRLIDRFPLVVILGAGLLGWIAGGMLVTDVIVQDWLAGIDIPQLKLIAEIVGALLVMAAGKLFARYKLSRQAAAANKAAS